MKAKLVWTLALIGTLIVIGPAGGCKLCGMHWCSCGAAPLLPSVAPRSWQMEHSPPSSPIELSLPLMEHRSASPLCQYCGGYNRGYHGYSPRNEAAYSRGYYCRCSPRGHRYRYDDY